MFTQEHNCINIKISILQFQIINISVSKKKTAVNIGNFVTKAFKWFLVNIHFLKDISVVYRLLKRFCLLTLYLIIWTVQVKLNDEVEIFSRIWIYKVRLLKGYTIHLQGQITTHPNLVWYFFNVANECI